MKIIARIFLLPFIIFPPLMGKMWFPKYWNKMKELAKKQYEIEKVKIEKEYEKLKKEESKLRKLKLEKLKTEKNIKKWKK